MHKDDKMTPNERMRGFIKGEDIDRIPIVPFITGCSGKVMGMSPREKRSSARNLFLCQGSSYEYFGHDGISVEYGLHGIGISQGTVMTNPENNVPSVKEHWLKILENFEEKVDLEKVSVRYDSWAKMNYEMAEMALDKYGKEVGVSIGLPGPFSAAISLYPIEKLLKATRKQPERAHALLRFCTDALKLVAKEFLDLGTGASICDPAASGVIMNEQMYREFVLPYTKELVDLVHSYGKMVTYHVCGNTTKLTEALVESGCNTLSIDNLVSLVDTKQRVGDKIILMGNVDPVDVMMQGTVWDVENSVVKCLREGIDNPKGYFLSTGCGIPIETPIENIVAFMDAGRKYGKWPIEKTKLCRHI